MGMHLGKAALLHKLQLLGDYPMERTGVITFQGKPFTLLGTPVKKGDKAPDFTLLANDLSPRKLGDYKGKTLIFSVVPSLDTGVCDMQTRRFNQEAAALGEHVRILTVSCDLPFAQARWCGAAGVTQLETLSDHYDLSFGMAYGVVIKELRLLTRSIFVVDANGIITYEEIVPEVTHEVNFDAALAAAKASR
jgi:Peroxiredoxin